jgi:hypothetical protein
MITPPGQGDRKIVSYDRLIPSCDKDGGGVDIQELGGVNCPIILLRQMGPELARPDYHPEMWCKRHAPPRGCWGARERMTRVAGASRADASQNLSRGCGPRCCIINLLMMYQVSKLLIY